MRYLFEDFVLDTEAYTLHRDGEEIAVEMRVLESLSLLIRERHRVISKEELLDSVWEVDFASEATLFKAIQQARKALGDDGRSQRLIKTVHGKGYRFVGEILKERTEVRAESEAETAATVSGRSERSPLRLSPRKLLLSAAVLAAVCLLAFAAFRMSRRVTKGTRHRVSVAVLPGVTDFKADSPRLWMGEALPELLGLRIRGAAGLRILSSDEVGEALEDFGVAPALKIPEEQAGALLERLGCEALISSQLSADPGGGLKLVARFYKARDRWSPEFLITDSRGDLFELVGAMGARLATAMGGASSAEGAWKPEVPPEAFARYSEGARAARDGDLNRAVSILAPLLAQHGNFPAARMALARVYMAMGLKEAAGREARTALGFSTSMSAESRLRLEALNEEIEGNWGEAARIYRSLTSVVPDETEYSLALIRALRWDGQSEEALEVAARAGESLREDPRLELELSRIYQLQGLPAKQRAALEKARALADARGAVGRKASAVLGLGWVDLSEGNLKEALHRFSEAEKLFESIDNRRGVSRCFKGRATAISYGSEPAKALPLFEESARMSRERGDLDDLSKTLYSLTALLAYLGETETSLRRAKEAIEVARRTGDREVEAAALIRQGDALVDLGRPAEGLKSYGEAMELLKAQQSSRRQGNLCNSMGLAFRDTGRMTSAKSHFERAMEIAQGMDDHSAWFTAGYNLAWLQVRLGDLTAAKRLLESLSLNPEGGSEKAALHHLKAGIDFEGGDFRHALEAVRKAEKIRESIREGAALDSSRELELDILLEKGEGEQVFEACSKMIGRSGEATPVSVRLRLIEALVVEEGWQAASEAFGKLPDASEDLPGESIQREILKGRIQAHLGRFPQAEEALDIARRTAEERGLGPMVTLGEIARAEVLILRGRIREAREDLGHLRRYCETRGWGRLAGKASGLMNQL